MRRNSWIVLLLITIVATGAAIWVAMRPEIAGDLDRRAGTMFPELRDDLDLVASLSVKSADGSFTIARGAGGTWGLVEKGGYPVPADQVKKALVALASLEFIEAKTELPERYGKIGVSDVGADGSDAVEIAAKDGDGKVMASLLLGKTKRPEAGTRPAEIYVRVPGEARAWLVSGRFDVKRKAIDWLDKNTVQIKGERIAEARYSWPDSTEVHLSRGAEGAPVTLEDIPEGRKAKAESDLKTMLEVLEFITYVDVAPAEDLDFSDAGEAHLRTFDGLAASVRIKPEADGKESSAWITVDVSAGDDASDEVRQEAAAMADRLDGWAYRLPGYRADRLQRRMADLTEPVEASGTAGATGN
ncbi:DUF4340 domain-containing protein [Oceanibacterium hippocampi]|uniref:DUF4340 domain-containing protein n=1 Tax=Oceanibacterium hippocampi TaxID=745714 RepID=A0A1Y5RDZ6_9PROT|nr:DUF4340 domain-containing protein [Oceanibacterium hippocampi]SLN14843.1 hypothetical protein OCH7691_00291 [Oceanibacterium hippocampi]